MSVNESAIALFTAESAELSWGLTGVVESIDRDQGAVPREKGLDHFGAVGNVVLVAAPLQVFMDRHEGGEPESGVGYTQDKGMGLGRGLAVGYGYGPFEAVFLGQPAKPYDGHFLGIFAEEGIDATSETTETGHVGVHLLESLV